MKPFLFTLIVFIGMVIFFIGNYNGYKHDAESAGNSWSLGEWLRHTALLISLSVVFFLPSLKVGPEQILQFEDVAAEISMGAVKGSTAAILGALLWGFGIPAMIMRTVIPILSKTKIVKTTRQVNREKLVH